MFCIHLFNNQINLATLLPLHKSNTYPPNFSTISPCKAGVYSIEGTARGVRPVDAVEMMKMLGEVRYLEELGVLVVLTGRGVTNP